ncbi:hypothetical protein M0802_011328 [Mischocyttarus mexicanus]|nr:hypothetical protein M0802_011328 [Mischocyttarus mexicanus]
MLASAKSFSILTLDLANRLSTSTLPNIFCIKALENSFCILAFKSNFSLYFWHISLGICAFANNLFHIALDSKLNILAFLKDSG